MKGSLRPADGVRGVNNAIHSGVNNRSRFGFQDACVIYGNFTENLRNMQKRKADSLGSSLNDLFLMFLSEILSHALQE